MTATSITRSIRLAGIDHVAALEQKVVRSARATCGKSGTPINFASGPSREIYFSASLKEIQYDPCNDLLTGFTVPFMRTWRQIRHHLRGFKNGHVLDSEPAQRPVWISTGQRQKWSRRAGFAGGQCQTRGLGDYYVTPA
jgi:hypothetical protein